MSASKINHPSEWAIKAARTLTLFWLLGWLVKGYFFKEYLFRAIVEYPFDINHFPLFFRSPEVVQFFYVLPFFVLLVLIRKQKFYFCFAAVVMMLSSAVLLLHQDTHNDATFVTSFWSGLWLLWFSCNMHREDDNFLIHARSLALCVVGLMFAGGFVGKLTADYWDGKILAQIFMEQDFGGISSWVRGHFSEEVIRFHFQWISKCVIVGEGILTFAAVLPYRFAKVFGIAMMIGLSFFTTWRIFSVLFSLIGLLIAVGKIRRGND